MDTDIEVSDQGLTSARPCSQPECPATHPIGSAAVWRTAPGVWICLTCLHRHWNQTARKCSSRSATNSSTRCARSLLQPTAWA